MWLTVEHVTELGYDEPIVEAYTEVRLKPAHRDGQRCSSFSLTTEPRGATIDEYVDRFGNVVHHFDVLEVHERLAVVARSEVWTTAAYEAEEPVLSPLDRWDYLAPTRYVDLDDQVIEVAAATGTPADPVEAAWELMRAVRDAMTYERGTTNVHTTAAEALADGRGVCQDFAHVLLGVCRAHALAARYVSGYLYDPSENGDGDRTATHAWVDVYEEGRGWISLDPTHDTEQTERYVRVGVGRDYADVPPTRGVYRGSAEEELDVSVEIRELGA
jgi:transglutaminase-like putative cysteine protease